MKPNTITTVASNGDPLFEYRGQIDFHIAQDWQVLTFMQDTMTMVFAMKISKTNLSKMFDIRTKALESNDMTLAITFVPLFSTRDKETKARRTLLRFLTHLKLPIIWKEHKHGYEISKSGRIHKSWKLNTIYHT